MENNEGNIKPQQTGGLKLMTVFIAVLALHVVVIGGFTVYHLLSSASNDPDLALDKNHKGAKGLADGSVTGDLPATEAASTEKITPTATTTPADLATAPAPVSPATSTPATTPLAPAATSPAPSVADTASAVSNPTSQTPSGPIQHGPVINPPENLTPAAPVASESSTITTPIASASADNDASANNNGSNYVVKKGDSLARIARQHHIALAKLKAANSFTSDKLHIGQKMMIPSRGPVLASTLSTTPMEAPSTGSEIIAPSAAASHSVAKTANGHHLYTVVKGDTLTKIARRYHTTPTAIMTANNMTDAARLSIGRKLRIPSGESRSAAASVPTPAPTEQPEAKVGPKGQLANYVQ